MLLRIQTLFLIIWLCVVLHFRTKDKNILWEMMTKNCRKLNLEYDGWCVSLLTMITHVFGFRFWLFHGNRNTFGDKKIVFSNNLTLGYLYTQFVSHTTQHCVVPQRSFSCNSVITFTRTQVSYIPRTSLERVPRGKYFLKTTIITWERGPSH